MIEKRLCATLKDAKQLTSQGHATNMLIDDARGWIKDYVAYYDVTNNKSLATERAHLIKESNLPNKLYKFRSVNDYALQNIREDNVWLNSPANYNDPYDCAATISAREIALAGFKSLPRQFLDPLRGTLGEEDLATALSSDDPVSAITRKVLSREEKFSGEMIDQMVGVMREALTSILESSLQKSVDSIRDGIKMCSFSEENETILMWSHYADNHSGFSIEYDVKALHALIRRMLYPVIYSSKRFDSTKYHAAAVERLESFNNLYGVLQALFKAPEWAYEREWRFVLGHGIIKEEQNYAFGRPSRIYLGAQMVDGQKKKVVDVCEAKGIPMSLMRLSHTEYKMEAYPLV